MLRPGSKSSSRVGGDIPSQTATEAAVAGRDLGQAHGPRGGDGPEVEAALRLDEAEDEGRRVPVAGGHLRDRLHRVLEDRPRPPLAIPLQGVAQKVGDGELHGLGLDRSVREDEVKHRGEGLGPDIHDEGPHSQGPYETEGARFQGSVLHRAMLDGGGPRCQRHGPPPEVFSTSSPWRANRARRARRPWGAPPRTRGRPPEARGGTGSWRGRPPGRPLPRRRGRR